MTGNLDLPYNTSSSVIDDEDTAKDVDHNNMSLLRQHGKQLDQWIAKHNTLDVIKDNTKLSGEQQIAVHKELVGYLRILRDDTYEKIKELTDG